LHPSRKNVSRPFRGAVPFVHTDWQEIVHYDEKSGERHIADIKTESGVIIEFQNSPMTNIERSTREEFYHPLVWVVNAAPFDFNLLEVMPDPTSECGSDLEWFHPYAFRKKSGPPQEVHIKAFEYGLEAAISESSNGHRAFEWHRARMEWLKTKWPVYFDLGAEDLWLFVSEFSGYISDRKATRLGTVKHLNKMDFVKLFTERC
jgi:competence protein CoiA